MTDSLQQLLDAGWSIVIRRPLDKSGPGGTPSQGSEYVHDVTVYRTEPEFVEGRGRRPSRDEAIADAWRVGEERLAVAVEAQKRRGRKPCTE